MNIQRILFPTDFSPASELALVHALFQAELHDAELHIVHCITWNDQEKLSLARLPDADTIMMHLQQVASVQLKETLKPHSDRTFKIKEKCVTGPRPVETILDYIKDNEMDMLVMGTHGRRGIYYFLMGSVAEEIVRRAEIPVITIDEAGKNASLNPVNKLLVPVDFSDQSRKALVRAKRLAALHKADLIALHVIQKLDFPGGGPDAGFAFMQNALPKIKEENTAHLQKMIDETAGPEVATQLVVDIGNPSRTIVEEAERRDVDLIVMPTHGRTGFNRLVLGSTAERVIRMAPCPVYTDKFN